MYNFSTEITGLPALLLMLGLFYLFFYLPIKFVVALIAHIKSKNDRLRRLQQRTVIAEYDPPHGLSPAEIGFIHDSKLNIAEVYATIVSLHHRNIVSLQENEKGLQILNINSEAPQLSEFEKLILKYCDEHKGKIITKRMLNGIRTMADFTIKKQLRDQGYLLTMAEQIKHSFLRLGLIMLGLYSLTILIFTPNSVNEFFGLALFAIFLFPLYFVSAAFLLAVVQKISGEPWLGTPKLKEAWSDIEGYRQFIQQVELDNIQFDTKNTEGIIKDKTLPYAIALGFNTGWLDKLRKS